MLIEFLKKLIIVGFVVREAIAECPVPLTSKPDDLGSKVPQNKLQGYFQCNSTDPGNDQSPCNAFVGRAVKELYGLTDFKTDSGYLLANDIAAKLAGGFKGWKPLGVLLDENNTYCVQSLANKGYPVIAALPGAGHGHVAIVLPGVPSKSGTWGIYAPNSASFRLGSVAESYVGKPLSASFSQDSAKRAWYYYKVILPF